MLVLVVFAVVAVCAILVAYAAILAVYKGVRLLARGIYCWIFPNPLSRAREALADQKDDEFSNFSRRSARVLAALDLVEEDLDILGGMTTHINPTDPLNIQHLPIPSAYRLSRLVRERMCYPSRSRANVMVAADHLRKEMEERCFRPHQRSAILPLAIEMVFMTSKEELHASMFRELIAGTWREAQGVAA